MLDLREDPAVKTMWGVGLKYTHMGQYKGKRGK
jgi:hypothetical protein